MKTLIIVLTIVMILGLWEYDELQMLYRLHKHHGKNVGYVDYNGGIGYDFPDGSRATLFIVKGKWFYSTYDGWESDAGKCIEDIRMHRPISKMLIDDDD